MVYLVIIQPHDDFPKLNFHHLDIQIQWHKNYVKNTVCLIQIVGNKLQACVF